MANQHLRVLVRPDNLTVSVDDLSTQQTWRSDPWENSAGRVHLRGKHGETTTLSLGAAIEKKMDARPLHAARQIERVDALMVLA